MITFENQFNVKIMKKSVYTGCIMLCRSESSFVF